MRRIHEGGVLDLFVDILVLIERECSRERDVDDDPRAPHVQGPVVALVTEHLGCQVGWGTNYRLSEPLFSNYSRESEVTQFNLKIYFVFNQVYRRNSRIQKKLVKYKNIK